MRLSIALALGASVAACVAASPSVPDDPIVERKDAAVPPAQRDVPAPRSPGPDAVAPPASAPEAGYATAPSADAADAPPPVDAPSDAGASARDGGAVGSVRRPYVFLNQREIDAIGLKVAAGVSPWKEAYAQTVAVANAALGTGPFVLPEGYRRRWCSDAPSGYAYDLHRYTARDFGHRLVNVALAWHLSKDAGKRADYLVWAKRNLTSWFLDPRTGMLPEGCTVGINASFPVVLYGMDLIWPALDDAMKAQLLTWARAFHESVKGRVDFGGVGGNHNRADWWVVMALVSGLVAEQPEVVELGRQHLEKRSVSATGEMSVGGAGVDSLANYTFFATTALAQVAEICRHHGIDAYEIGKIEGRSKLERIWDRMTPFAFDPKAWTAATGNVPARELYFSGTNLFSWELAYAHEQKPEYLKVLQREGRPVWDWKEGGHTDNSLGPVTLTHAHGAYPFAVVAP